MREAPVLEVNDGCRPCTLRKSCFLCQMPAEAVRGLGIARSTASHPIHTILFLENQLPRGIFVLCDGEIKLSISSKGGKTLILRIAKAGEILGLMAVLSGRPYEMTAEAISPCRVAFIRREDFVRFVNAHAETTQAIVKQLSSNYKAMCEQLRTVALAPSAPAKLARLLLEWDARVAQTNHPGGARLALTHEEIAEFIGASRETVTRTLNEFKNRKFIIIKESTLVISNRPALEALVAA